MFVEIFVLGRFYVKALVDPHRPTFYRLDAVQLGLTQNLARKPLWRTTLFSLPRQVSLICLLSLALPSAIVSAQQEAEPNAAEPKAAEPSAAEVDTQDAKATVAPIEEAKTQASTAEATAAEATASEVADAASGPDANVAETVDDERPPMEGEERAYSFDEKEERGEHRRLRIFANVGAGVGLRLVQNLEFQQDRFSPAYVEIQGGVTLPGYSRLRHSFVLAVNSNLNGDGGFDFGLDPFNQWTITPGYMLRIGFPDNAAPDIWIGAKVGVPLTIAPDFSVGAELAASFTYMFLAGFGIYAEAGASMFFGADSRAGNLTVHPILALELGVAFDFEVLP